MAELNRRGFFKGLLGLAAAFALPAPSIVKADEIVPLEPIVELLPKQIFTHSFGLGLTPEWLNRYKGEILQHTAPIDIFMTHGRQVKMPKNRYISRRYIPYGKRNKKVKRSDL